MNRLHQLRRTLPRNLKLNKSLAKSIEFVLIDIGPTKGLLAWARKTCGWALKTGYLKIFRVKAKFFHAPYAKNTAHAKAKGKILVNLDGDVLLPPHSAKKIIRVMRKYKGRALLHLLRTKGTFGCIAYPRKYFRAIGGYNQKFGPVGYQDVDIILRLVRRYHLPYVVGTKGVLTSRLARIHMKGRRKVVNVGLPRISAIKNSKKETIKNTKVKEWGKMNKKNATLGRRLMAAGKYIANGGKGQGWAAVRVR